MKLYSSYLTGHSLFQKTYACANHSFFCPGMNKDIYSFISKCDIFPCNKGELIRPPSTLHPYLFQPLSAQISLWDSLWGYPRKVTNQLSWWLLTWCPNMLTSMHLHTSSLWPWSPKYSLIRFLNYMAFLHPYCVTGTPYSLVSSGRNSSNFKELNKKWSLPIMLRQMTKLRKLINVWTCICIDFHLKRSTSGSNGFL